MKYIGSQNQFSTVFIWCFENKSTAKTKTKTKTKPK